MSTAISTLLDRNGAGPKHGLDRTKGNFPMDEAVLEGMSYYDRFEFAFNIIPE